MDSTSLTPLEVAELLKITKNTVYELIKRGELPAYKVGKKLRIDKEDINNYINNQRTYHLFYKQFLVSTYETIIHNPLA